MTNDHVLVMAVTGNLDTLNRLRHVFSHTRWTLLDAADGKSAMRLLRREPVAVVITEAELEDGGWKDLLRKVRGLSNPPNLIVTACNADEVLWTEVLSAGAYDLLPRPFERAEVTRIVGLAWREWCRRQTAVREEEEIAVHA